MRRLILPAALRPRIAGPTLGSAVASGVSAATTLLVAQGIGAAGFGRFTVVLSIALIVTVGMLMSLHYVMLQELPRAAPEDRPALLTTALAATLVLGSLVAAAGMLAAPVLTTLLGVDVRTLGFGLALAMSMTLNHLTECVLRGLGRYVRTAVLKLTVALAYLGGSAYCLLVLGLRDAEVYLTALIATNTAFAVVAVAGSGARPRAWRAALVRPLYRLGGYVTAVAALTGVAFGLDVIFLNHWAAPAEVGVYSVYNGFPKRLLGVLFTDGVGLALLPAMATMDKPELLRRIGRLVPAVALGTAAVAFAASLVFFLLLRAQYPYAVDLMALSAAGIGAHTVFNLYSVTLLMDGVRGSRLLIACLGAGTPLVLGLQAALIAGFGLYGGLIAFALSNAALVVMIAAAAARAYRAAPRAVPDGMPRGPLP